MKKGKLDDARLEEVVDGLMGQFRIVRDHPEDVETEMKIYDSISNGAGKILKAYMIDITMSELSQTKIAQRVEAKEIAEGGHDAD